jgi:hypothetical protein
MRPIQAICLLILLVSTATTHAAAFSPGPNCSGDFTTTLVLGPDRNLPSGMGDGTFKRLAVQGDHSALAGPGNPLADIGLRRLGNAGMSLMPAPRWFKRAMGRSPLGTAAFATGVIGGAAAPWAVAGYMYRRNRE